MVTAPVGFVHLVPLTPAQREAERIKRFVESLVVEVWEHGTMEYSYYTDRHPAFDKPRAVLIESVVNGESGVLAVRVWMKAK